MPVLIAGLILLLFSFHLLLPFLALPASFFLQFLLHFWALPSFLQPGVSSVAAPRLSIDGRSGRVAGLVVARLRHHQVVRNGIGGVVIWWR
jgi:hypothetical protein